MQPVFTLQYSREKSDEVIIIFIEGGEKANKKSAVFLSFF